MKTNRISEALADSAQSLSSPVAVSGLRLSSDLSLQREQKQKAWGMEQARYHGEVRSILLVSNSSQDGSIPGVE